MTGLDLRCGPHADPPKWSLNVVAKSIAGRAQIVERQLRRAVNFASRALTNSMQNRAVRSVPAPSRHRAHPPSRLRSR